MEREKLALAPVPAPVLNNEDAAITAENVCCHQLKNNNQLTMAGDARVGVGMGVRGEREDDKRGMSMIND